ncbi:MAG: hypothetical protein JWO38_6237 [Gemmataceae bacterium]|nr:hypothetical protein [Gemmataceae bacterium]
MYSLVLMSAMSTAPNTAEFNGYFRDLFRGGNCSGCTGCTGCCGGSARYSCYGGCSGSSDYSSCNGCCGGLFSGFGSRVRSWFNAGGCCGGCCGGNYARSIGCSGVSYGCYGSAAYSCFGGPVAAYTPVFNGGVSCQGGPIMSAPAPVFEPYPSSPSYPGGPAPVIPYSEPVPAPPPGGPGINIERSTSGPRPAGYSAPAATVVANPGGMANRATVLVRLPADAKLYADGTPLRMTGGERKFVTPELPGGMEFTYRFTVEYERNGEVVSVTKKVPVRAGGSGVVEFADLTATKPVPTDGPAAPAGKSESLAAAPVSISKPDPTPVVPSVLPGGVNPGTAGGHTPAGPPATAGSGAGDPQGRAERATITVKLPAGATLYVDDRKSPSADPVRRFTTPPLPAGREFGYLLRAEVVRNGQPEYVMQKVAFRAGEQVVVDFTTLGTGQ